MTRPDEFEFAQSRPQSLCYFRPAAKNESNAEKTIPSPPSFSLSPSPIPFQTAKLRRLALGRRLESISSPELVLLSASGKERSSLLAESNAGCGDDIRLELFHRACAVRSSGSGKGSWLHPEYMTIKINCIPKQVLIDDNIVFYRHCSKPNNHQGMSIYSAHVCNSVVNQFFILVTM